MKDFLKSITALEIAGAAFGAVVLWLGNLPPHLFKIGSFLLILWPVISALQGWEINRLKAQAAHRALTGGEGR